MIADTIRSGHIFDHSCENHIWNDDVKEGRSTNNILRLAYLDAHLLPRVVHASLCIRSLLHWILLLFLSSIQARTLSSESIELQDYK